MVGMIGSASTKRFSRGWNSRCKVNVFAKYFANDRERESGEGKRKQLVKDWRV